MTKEVIIQKVIDELTINGICLIFNPHIFGTYMEQIWVTGMEYGSKRLSHQRTVIQMDLLGNFLTEFPSAAEAARVTGVSKTGIKDCCNGKYNQARGCKWKYKEL